MKNKIGVLLLFLFATATQAAVITWNNAAGGNWQTAANWNPQQVPGAADTAVISLAGDYSVTLSANVNVHSLTLGVASGTSTQTLVLAGRTLRATNVASVVANGALTVDGNSSMEGNWSVLSGGMVTFSGAGTKSMYGVNLLNAGTMRWTGGGIALGSTPTTTITNSGLFEISTDDQMYHGIGGPVPRLVNTGIMRKLAGAGTTTFSTVQLVNVGAIEVQSGTIQLNSTSGAIFGGTVNVATGTTFTLASGTFTENGGIFTGPGVRRITGGTLTLVGNLLEGLSLNGGTIILAPTFQGGAITNLTLNGAVLSGTNEVAGTMVISAGGFPSSSSVIHRLTVRSGATLDLSGSAAKELYNLSLVNNGTVRWLGGPIYLGSSMSSTITNAGLWEISSDASMSQGIGGVDPTFVNNGTVRKIAGQGTTSLSSVKFINAGAIEIQNGTITWNSSAGSVLGGTVTTADGTTFQLSSGTYTENAGVFSGTGAMRMTGGTLTLVNNRLQGLSLNGGNVVLAPTFQLAGAITNLTLNGAVLLGTNEVAGTFIVAAGGFPSSSSVMQRLTVRNGATLELSGAGTKEFYNLMLINNGTVRWLGGTFYGGSSHTTIITNQGLWEIAGDFSMNQGIGGPDPIFVNTGTFRKIAGIGTASISNFQFQNFGLLDVMSGNFQFNSSANSIMGGTFSAQIGSNIILASGTYREAGGSFTGLGAFRMNGGTLTLANNLLQGLSMAGGNIVVGPAFQSAGAITNMTINGAVLTGTNEVAGTLTITSGGAPSSSSILHRLTIRPGGFLDLSGSGTKEFYNLMLVNNGTVRWLGGTIYLGSSQSSIVTNTGLWEIYGDYTLSQGIGGPDPIFVNTGTIKKSAGIGTASFSNIHFQNYGLIEIQSGTIQFNSVANFILGGTFTAQPSANLVLASGTYREAGALYNGGGSLRMTGGTLTLVNERTAGLALNGGNVVISPTFQAAGAITNLTLSGAVLLGTNEVAGTLTVSSGGSPSSSSVMHRLTIRPGAFLDLPGTGIKEFYNLMLVNNGTVRWLGGTIYLGSGQSTIITNFGIWEISSDNSFTHGIGGPEPVFVNRGIIRKVLGTGVTSFSSFRFENYQTVEVQTGTLQFNSLVNSILSGQFTTLPGASIIFASGAYREAGAVFSGGGTARMNGGTLTLVNDRLLGLDLTGGNLVVNSTFQASGAITNLTINGAALTGTNEVAGLLIISAGGFPSSSATTHRLTIRAGATLELPGTGIKEFYNSAILNNGTVRWLGGTIYLGSSQSTAITNVGLWEISSDATISQGIGGPEPRFINDGTIRKIGGAGTTTMSGFVFQNNSLIEGNSGTIRFPSSQIFSGGTLRLNGGRFETPNTLTVAGGRLEGAGTMGSTVFTGGTLSPGVNGPGRITFSSGLNLNSATTVSVDATGPIAGTGHDQIAVNGFVNLGGANLQVGAIADVLVGTRLIIVDNDLNEATTNQFSGFAEGQLFEVSPQLFRIRYATGTGNDVALIRDDGGVRLTIARLTNGFRISGIGTNLVNYAIQTTTNFTTWTELGVATSDSGGNFQYIDPQTNSYPYRFYRSFGPGISVP